MNPTRGFSIAALLATMMATPALAQDAHDGLRNVDGDGLDRDLLDDAEEPFSLRRNIGGNLSLREIQTGTMSW